MKTERFEAFIDAVLAIIITIIVLEIPEASTGSWSSLGALHLEFITYAISFIVIFNYWNFHNNIFDVVNSINSTVIWSDAASLFVISFLPFLTTFVSSNFYTFLPQFLYGLDFILVSSINIVTGRSLINADKGNIALLLVINKNKGQFLSILIIIFGMIIGYLLFPPAIIISCLITIIIVWIFNIKEMS